MKRVWFVLVALMCIFLVKAEEIGQKLDTFALSKQALDSFLNNYDEEVKVVRSLKTDAQEMGLKGEVKSFVSPDSTLEFNEEGYIVFEKTLNNTWYYKNYFTRNNIIVCEAYDSTGHFDHFKVNEYSQFGDLTAVIETRVSNEEYESYYNAYGHLITKQRGKSYMEKVKSNNYVYDKDGNIEIFREDTILYKKGKVKMVRSSIYDYKYLYVNKTRTQINRYYKNGKKDSTYEAYFLYDDKVRLIKRYEYSKKWEESFEDLYEYDDHDNVIKHNHNVMFGYIKSYKISYY